MDYKHYPDENMNETITYAEYNTDVNGQLNYTKIGH